MNDPRMLVRPGSSPPRRARFLAPAILVLLAACGRTPQATTHAYQPRTRDLTVTTVPLVVREEQGVLPFLKEDFAKGGVLEGKEVYGFSPSTFTVVEGDTIRFTLINPEDDVHSFVLPDLAVQMPGQTTTHATYVAKRAGIFPIVCAVPSHLPMMSGQLVVLPAAAMAGADTAVAARRGGAGGGA
jgi:uncharacterized cupredoxin-like copper-binding protein